MIDFILQSSQLPNLHPALVHFPIALLPVALGFDVVSLVPAVRRRRTLDVATTVLYVLTALAAWASAWSGEEAEHSLTGLPPSVERLIHEHEEAAERFLYVIAVVAVIRLVVTWWVGLRPDRAGRPAALALRGLVLAGGIAAMAFLVNTADQGGGLVYRAGVAVMAVPAADEADAGADGETSPQGAGELE